MTDPYDSAPAASAAEAALSRKRHGRKNTRGAQDG
jgi:hypothetical protein